MYAKISNVDKQLIYYTKTFIRHGGVTYSNPPEWVMNLYGWYLVPSIPHGKRAKFWQLIDGKLVPELVDINQNEDATPLKLSKLNIVVCLKEMNLYGKFKEWLVQADLVDEWDVAQDIKTNNDMFVQVKKSLCQYLGIDEQQCDEIIEQCVMTED